MQTGPLLAVLTLFAASAATAADICPGGSWLDAYSGTCAPLSVRMLPAQRAARSGQGSLPSLVDLRARKFRASSRAGDGMPVPGGLGSGVEFASGTLSALQSADLQTTMFVHPGGVNPSQPIDFLFTTSTNRTDKTIEVVGIYTGTTGGDIGVFDWSCSPDYPCPNSSTGPSWQWTQPFSDFACNLEDVVDAGGHPHQAIRYSNSAVKEDDGSPPLWVNRVLFWNVCTAAWDLVYEHSFRVDQRDCSIGDFTCGWWGPIMETFNVIPQMAELGFEDTVLIHDGTTSLLPAAETTFDPPHDPCTGDSGGACWQLCHLHPDDAYGVGNDCTAAGCPATAATDCFSAGKGSLSLKRATDPSKTAFSWKWTKGAAPASQSDFGDPKRGDTTVRVCVYETTGASSALTMGAWLPRGGTCSGRDCWNALGTIGWSYKNRDATPAGVTSAVLRGGVGGEPSIKVNGKGALLRLPPPASPETFFNADTVLVQLHRSDPASLPGCWSSTFDVGHARRNDAAQFKAMAP